MISRLMNGTLKKGQSIAVAAVGVLAGLGIASAPAKAAIFTLQDGNSTASFNIGDTLDTSEEPGLYEWLVDDVSHFFRQSYFYRIGNTGPESPVESLMLGNALATDTDGNGLNDNLFARFTSNLFDLDISWRLAGGTPGSGTADIAETVRITNKSNGNLAFRLFEYDDADLGGTASGDTATLLNDNVFQQTDGVYKLQISGIPTATAYEAATYPTILDKLEDGDADNLNNTINATNTDASFAWQWNFNIGRGASVIVSKDKLISKSVPEPTTTLAFLAIAPLALTTLKRNKQKPE